VYASGFCESCIIEEQRQAAVADAREADEHAPQEGSLWDNAYTTRVLDAWDRGLL